MRLSRKETLDFGTAPILGDSFDEQGLTTPCLSHRSIADFMKDKIERNANFESALRLLSF
jgi:hypothetical protein